MRKRARTYGEQVYDVDLPDSIVQAIERSPRYYPRTPPPKPKAFANPRSYGYGGPETPWPFDRRRAYEDARYRSGIRNAIGADWTASNWKFVAQRLLTEVVEDLLALEQLHEELELDELIEADYPDVNPIGPEAPPTTLDQYYADYFPEDY